MSFFPIPDKIYKFFVSIGLVVFVYSLLTVSIQSETSKKDKIKYQTEIRYIRLQHDDFLREINEKCEPLFQRYKTPTPINDIDSVICILKIIDKKEPNNIIVQLYVEISCDLKRKIEKQFIKREELEQFIELADEKIMKAGWFIPIGYLFSCVGLFMWIARESFETDILKRKSLNLPTYSDRCQSCGKVFNSIVHYGTETDSQKNYHFCSECFKNGCFTAPEMTLNTMKYRVKKELIKKNKSSCIICFHLKQLSKLERWK